MYGNRSGGYSQWGFGIGFEFVCAEFLTRNLGLLLNVAKRASFPKLKIKNEVDYCRNTVDSRTPVRVLNGCFCKLFLTQRVAKNKNKA